jgi:hypothetical protein
MVVTRSASKASKKKHPEASSDAIEKTPAPHLIPAILTRKHFISGSFATLAVLYGYLLSTNASEDTKFKVNGLKVRRPAVKP